MLGCLYAYRDTYTQVSEISVIAPNIISSEQIDPILLL